MTTRNVKCGVEGTSCSRQIEITYIGVTILLIRGQGIQVGNITYDEEQVISLGNGEIRVQPTTLFSVVILEGITISWSHSEYSYPFRSVL